MSEQEDKTAKPFYDNIVSSRKRTHQHDPKKKTDDDSARSHRKVTQPSQPSHAPRASRAGSEERFSGNDRSKGSETRVPRAARTTPRDERTPSRDDSPDRAPRALRHDHSTKDGTRAPRTPRASRTSRFESGTRLSQDNSAPRTPRDNSAPRAERAPRRDSALLSDRPARAPRSDGAPHADRSARAPRSDSVSRASREGYQGKPSAAPRGDRTPHGDRPGRESRSDSVSRAPRSSYKSFEAPPEFVPVFGALPKDVKHLLESFPEIVQSSFPLDSKKILQLPGQIRELSHELTDERSDRRVGYLNDPIELSAYIRYYMWWNLVRLTRLFVSLPISLDDGDTAVDLGSGPLTLPIALWMARPDLRKKKISWYCVDISQGALAAGEELFLSLAAKTGDEPWQITRVKGECGISLRRKVALVASANMFNELFWDNPLPLEAQTKHHAEELVSYAARDASILVIEPGIPRAGRFVSLLRDSLMRLGFSPVSPCPHEGACPFPGLRYGKWCHFVFDTTDAPAGLLKLSEEADLPKDRAALSFVFAKQAVVEPEAEISDDKPADALDGAEETAVTQIAKAAKAAKAAPLSASFASDTVIRLSGMFTGLRVRITSDPIKLPDFYTGRYGCSELGMVMITGTYQAADYLKECNSGSLIEVPMPDKRNPERDYKTGAIIIKLK